MVPYFLDGEISSVPSGGHAAYTFQSSPGQGHEWDIIGCTWKCSDPALQGLLTTPPLTTCLLAVIPATLGALDLTTPPPNTWRHWFQPYFDETNFIHANFHPPLPILVPESHFVQLWFRNTLTATDIQIALQVADREREKEPYLTALINVNE